MYAMQYEIALPTDYDMQYIRDRVAATARTGEELPGLELKAYLIQDRHAGAPRNQYAPFCLWTDVAAAGRFLWGGGPFGEVVKDFGRPQVHSWLAAHHAAGPAHALLPGWAVRVIRPLPADLALDQAVPEAVAQFIDRTTRSTHTLVLAVDPTAWTVCEFTLRVDRPEPSPDGCVYQVLHVSSQETERE
jgi:Domain of unknown function (DUF4865)